MGAGRLEPHTTVEPNQQLTGEQLLQIGPDLAVRGQQPAREGGGQSLRVHLGFCSRARRVLPSDQTQRDGEEQTTFSKYPHPVCATCTVNTRQLWLHVSVGNDEVSKHQVAHLEQVRQWEGLSLLLTGGKGKPVAAPGLT